MSPLGHHVTSLCLGAIGTSLIVSSGSYTSITEFTTEIIDWLIEGYTDIVPHSIYATSLLIGVLIGSRSPDWLEWSYFVGDKNKRVIKHRTLTHSPWLWLIVTALGIVIYSTTVEMTKLSGVALIGWGASSLLHVLIDMMSPTGIPLGNPFGKRYSFTIYRTNKLSELYVIMPIVISTAIYFKI